MRLEELEKIVATSLSPRTSLGIELTTTQCCNCRCKYCFEHDAVQTSCQRDIQEEARQLNLISAFCQKFDTAKHDQLMITFWGGEPMLNLEFVKQVIETTISYDFVSYYMFTNGTLFESFKDLVQTFNTRAFRKKMHFQLSYDGEPHNRDKRGDLSSTRVLETARWLKSQGFRLSFKATLSFDMIQHLPAIWKSYEQLHDEFGFEARYAPTLDMTGSCLTEDKLQVWMDSVLEVAKLEFKFIKKHQYPLMKHFEPGSRKVCDITHSVMMHNDGRFYVCHGCIYSKDQSKFILGDTSSTADLEEVFQKMSSIVDLDQENDNCKHCSATYCTVCHSACVDPDNMKTDWIKCISNDVLRCRFMRVFGLAARALKLAVDINRQ